MFAQLTPTDWLEAIVLFAVSFFLGLWLGWLFWGKFKRKYSELQEKYNSILVELNDWKAKFQDLDAQNRDLDLKFKDITTRYGNLEVQYDRSVSKVKELDGTILGLGEQLEQSRGKVTALEGFQVKYNELLPAYEADRQRIADLQMKINNMDAQRGELNELITSLRPFRTRFEDLQVQYNNLKAEKSSLEGIKGDLERTAQADLKVAAKLEQQLSELQLVKGDLERTAQADLKYVAQLQQQLDASKQELEALKLSKGEWEQSASNDAGRVTELEQQLAAVQQELEELKQVKSDLERTAQADLKMVGGLESRLHEAQQELKDLRHIYNELQRTAQADLSYVGRLEEQVAELKSGATLSAPVVAEPEPVAVVDESWKEAEAALLADPRLAKIRERAGEMNFDRIGLAAPGERDDLKLIKGIGPFIEKKLNALNIYTFRQISNFTQEDVEKATEVIAFFPGRIERDEWVKQAANFVANGVPTNNVVPNDLKIVEGIGPKIEGLLHKGGIKTWAALAAAQVSRIQEILDAAGDRYRIHDPSTWPYQASLADEGKWEDLEKLQEELIGGRKS